MHRRLSPLTVALSTLLALSPTLLPTRHALLPAIAQTQPNQTRKAESAGEANRLYKQGEDQLNQGQLPAALESLQKALEIYRSLQDRKQEGQTLRLIGNVYFSQKDYTKTIEFQQQTLTVARAIQDADLEARALSNIGLAYASLKQLDKARSYYEQSLVVSRRFKNFKMIAITTSNLFASYDNEDYAKSRLVLQDALNRLPNGVDKARLLLNLGDTYLLEAIGVKEKFTTEQLQQEKASVLPLYARAVSIYQQALGAMKTAPDSLLQGNILTQMGSAYVGMDKYARGIESLKEAVSLYKQLSNPSRQLGALTQLMLSYSLWQSSITKQEKDYQQALNASEQIIALAPEAIALAKALNQPADEKDVLYIQATAHFRVSLIYLDLQDLPQAKEQAEQAWILANQSGMPKARSIALTALNSYYNTIGDYTKQLEVKQQTLRIAQLASNPFEESHALASLASSYSLLGNVEKQLQSLQEAATKVSTVTDKNLPDYATTEDLLLLKRNIAMGFAVFYGVRGDHDQELAFARQALELSRQMSDRKEEFYFLLRVGNVYSSRKEYAKAQQMAQQALTLAKTLIQPKLEIEALIALSKIMAAQSNPQNAMEYAQQALVLVQQQKSKQSIRYGWIELEFNVLYALHSAYKAQGNYAKALEVLRKGIEISEQSANPSRKQTAIFLLGDFYLKLGDYSNATAQLQRMLSLAQAQQYPLYQQAALSFLGYLAFSQQNPSQAIDWAQQGLTISRQIQYPEGEFNNLLALSRGYGELGDESKAMAAAQATLDLARKMGNVEYQQSATQTLGDLHRRFGRWNQALASYETALASGSRSASTYAGLAQVYVQRNQPIAAIAFYKQAINNFEAYRRNLRGLSTDLQQSYLQSTLDFGGVKTADIYRQLADLLIAQGRILEAQQILELLRVEEIKDATQPLRGNQKPDNIALSPLEQELTRKHGSLIAFGRDVEQCRDAKPQPCAQLNQLIAQLTRLNDQYNTFIRQFDAEIRNNRKQDEATVDPSQLNYAQRLIETTQQKTQKNSVLVYPLVLDKRLWIVWVSSAGVRKSQPVLVSQSELAKTVIEFRRLMQECERRTCGEQDTAKIQTVSRQLYDWLIRPIEPELTKNKVENLIFALDRVVRYIPMAALYDGNQYLIQKYTVSTVLSAGLTQVGDRAPFTPDQTQILGLGLSNPVSNLTVAGSRYDFAELSYVPIELGAIVRGNLPNAKGIFAGAEMLNNFDANTLSAELYKRKYRILHLATHGKFVPGNALASFLLLGNGQPFTVSDIQNLTSLDTIDLIVLSACESALGGAEGAAKDPTKLDGIEISSMSYHFLSKQAKTVLASLWQVNDPSTALLMQQFYKYLAAGKTKAQALQEAQRHLLEGNITDKDASRRADVDVLVEGRSPTNKPAANFSHPYYWAPFILIGNGL
jgi:CHAT domain-containing protein